jgi:heat shock protein HspQ
MIKSTLILIITYAIYKESLIISKLKICKKKYKRILNFAGIIFKVDFKSELRIKS